MAETMLVSLASPSFFCKQVLIRLRKAERAAAVPDASVVGCIPDAAKVWLLSGGALGQQALCLKETEFVKKESLTSVIIPV